MESMEPASQDKIFLSSALDPHTTHLHLTACGTGAEPAAMNSYMLRPPCINPGASCKSGPQLRQSPVSLRPGAASDMRKCCRISRRAAYHQPSRMPCSNTEWPQTGSQENDLSWLSTPTIALPPRGLPLMAMSSDAAGSCQSMQACAEPSLTWGGPMGPRMAAGVFCGHKPGRLGRAAGALCPRERAAVGRRQGLARPGSQGGGALLRCAPCR